MTNVMIVEDDILISELLQHHLEGDGYHVTGIARTVEEALDCASRSHLDCAVIDIKLANGGLGTDVAAHLRHNKSIGILFSTGNDDHLLTSDQGDAIMRKPYRMKDVACGLKIVDDFGRLGHTDRVFPRNFRLLVRVAPVKP